MSLSTAYIPLTRTFSRPRLSTLAPVFPCAVSILNSPKASTFPFQLFTTTSISYSTAEAYNAELEKTNASVLAENQNLLNENKQLNALVREYEQTLETIMSKFRTHAVCSTSLSLTRPHTHLIFQHASQEHELALTRQYERQLLNHETTVMQQELSQTMAISVALSNISNLLRQTLRATGGEDISTGSSDDEDYLFPGKQGQEAWSLERECELVRLQRENEHLLALLDVDQSDTGTVGAELATITEAVRLKWNQNAAHVEDMGDGQSHGQAYGSLLQLGGPRRVVGLGRGKPKPFGMGNASPW